MLGMWMVYALVGVTSITAGLFATKAGRRQLRKLRQRRWTKGVKATQSAVRGHKRHKANTARGQLQAQRRKEDYRLGFGHRRVEGDETRTRKAGRALRGKAREAWYQYKANAENRKAQWVPEQGTSQKSTVSEGWADGTRGGLCGARNRDGTRCMHHVGTSTRTCSAGHVPKYRGGSR